MSFNTTLYSRAPSAWMENEEQQFRKPTNVLTSSTALTVLGLYSVLVPSSLPSTLTGFPGPADEKHLYNHTMLPPPCFTVQQARRHMIIYKTNIILKIWKFNSCFQASVPLFICNATNKKCLWTPCEVLLWEKQVRMTDRCSHSALLFTQFV